jgi:DNA-binding ferritin-like protein (Dps family)
MEETLKALRLEVATKAKEYKTGKLAWRDFMQGFGRSTGVEDSLIEELVDMIEHEPKRGGFMGVNEKEWKQYEDRINVLIEELLR